jgi:hypothetical protein
VISEETKNFALQSQRVQKKQGGVNFQLLNNAVEKTGGEAKRKEIEGGVY